MAGPLNLEQLLSFLIDTPMFGDLDTVELSQIVHIMQLKHLRPGQTLFAEGQPGDAWYVVFEGEVDVSRETATGPEVIDHLTPRSCFGEMAILDGSPRSASVAATGDATVLRFPREAFRRLLDEGNLAAYKLVLQMALVLVSRQRETTRRLAETLRLHQDAGVRQRLKPIVARASRSE
jgi:CRP-like cAMP-binding protein